MKRFLSLVICVGLSMALLGCSGSSSESTLSENQMYSLDGMSVEDIEGLFDRLTDVSTGDAISDYSNRFDVQPNQSNEQSGQYYFYVDNQSDVSNYIQQISVGAQIEMDGTITVVEDCESTAPELDNSYIGVVLILNDYDTAVALYDYADNLALDYTIHYAPTNRNRNDNREGTEWNSNVYRFVQEMNKVGDNYEVRLELPISSYLRSR